MYPNPFSSSLHLSLDAEKTDIYIFDSTGRLVEQFKQIKNEVEVGDNLVSGIYSLVIYQKEIRTVFRIIKNSDY